MLRIPRLILHIGSHKTGTSSLQRFLHDSQAELRRSSILYPDALRPPKESYGHHELPRLADLRADLRGDQFEKMLVELDEEFARSSCETLLLSSETLFPVKHKDQIANALHADTVEIYVSLRPQYDIASAMYYTHLRGRQLPKSPQEYLPELARYFDYAAILTEWRTCYPSALFYVRRFEKGQPARMDAIGDFIDQLKLPLAAPAPDQYRNHPSLPAKGILFVRALAGRNLERQEFLRNVQFLHRHLDLLGAEKSVYSPDERRSIHQASGAINRRVRLEFGDGRNDDFFEEPELGDERAWQAEVGEAAAVEWEVFLGLLSRMALLQKKFDGGGGQRGAERREPQRGAESATRRERHDHDESEGPACRDSLSVRRQDIDPL